jgi:hypothetical protein
VAAANFMVMKGVDEANNLDQKICGLMKYLRHIFRRQQQKKISKNHVESRD